MQRHIRSHEEALCPLIPDRIGIWSVGFCGGRKTREPGEKPLGARITTNNKLNPHMAPGWKKEEKMLLNQCYKIANKVTGSSYINGGQRDRSVVTIGKRTT